MIIDVKKCIKSFTFYDNDTSMADILDNEANLIVTLQIDSITAMYDKFKYDGWVKIENENIVPIEDGKVLKVLNFIKDNYNTLYKLI